MPVSARDDRLIHLFCHPPRQPVFFPRTEAVQFHRMNEFAMHAQEESRQFYMPRLAGAVLIPNRMIEYDKRARIAGKRLEHSGDSFDFWSGGEPSKVRENRTGGARRDIV